MCQETGSPASPAARPSRAHSAERAQHGPTQPEDQQRGDDARSPAAPHRSVSSTGQLERQPAPRRPLGGRRTGCGRAKKTARFAITPTTAAVMPVSAAESAAVAAQPLDVRRAEEDEDEAGDEGDPGGEQRAEDGGHPRVERAGVAVGAEERDELHDHDQRAGRRLGERQAAHHLPRRQPPVDLDGLLRHVGQHGVRPAERDQGGAGEEQPLLGEHAVRPVSTATSPTGTPQASSPTAEDRGRVRRGRALAVQGVVGDERRRAVVRRRRGLAVRCTPGPTGRAAQPTAPASGDDDRERHPTKRQGQERRDREGDQGRAVRARACRPGRPPGRRSPAPPGRARRTRAVTAVVSPNADVDRRQRQQRDHAGQHEQGAGDQAAADAVAAASRRRWPAAGPRGRAAACSSSGRAGTGAARSSAARRPARAA